MELSFLLFYTLGRRKNVNIPNEKKKQDQSFSSEPITLQYRLFPKTP